MSANAGGGWFGVCSDGGISSNSFIGTVESDREES